MNEKYRVAIAGATGAVGVEFLRLLEERKFPVAELRRNTTSALPMTALSEARRMVPEIEPRNPRSMFTVALVLALLMFVFAVAVL